MSTFLDSFIIFGICLTSFLIFRTLVLWYWKIDKIVELLEKITANTKKETEEKEAISSEQQ